MARLTNRVTRFDTQTRSSSGRRPAVRTASRSSRPPAPDPPPARAARPASRESRSKPPARPKVDVEQAVIEGAKLTERDEQMLTLLGRHHVATEKQLARAFFNADRTAHDRLKKLTERNVLYRFRGTCPGPGSLPFVYCLGVHGAVLYAATDPDKPIPTTGQVNQRHARLARSTTLAHQLAVVDFFTRLLATARTAGPGTGLDDWLPEPEAANECGGIVRPDAYAEWHQPSPHNPNASTTAQSVTASAAGAVVESGVESGVESVAFFFELDTGTERPLDRVLDKIDRYATVAAAADDDPGPLPVLFQIPNATREHHLHAALAEHYGPHGPDTVPVATTTAEHVTSRVGPAGAIWWPTGSTGGTGIPGRRVPLIHTDRPGLVAPGWGAPR